MTYLLPIHAIRYKNLAKVNTSRITNVLYTYKHIMS